MVIGWIAWLLERTSNKSFAFAQSAYWAIVVRTPDNTRALRFDPRPLRRGAPPPPEAPYSRAASPDDDHSWLRRPCACHEHRPPHGVRLAGAPFPPAPGPAFSARNGFRGAHAATSCAGCRLPALSSPPPRGRAAAVPPADRVHHLRQRAHVHRVQQAHGRHDQRGGDHRPEPGGQPPAARPRRAPRQLLRPSRPAPPFTCR